LETILKNFLGHTNGIVYIIDGTHLSSTSDELIRKLLLSSASSNLTPIFPFINKIDQVKDKKKIITKVKNNFDITYNDLSKIYEDGKYNEEVKFIRHHSNFIKEDYFQEISSKKASISITSMKYEKIKIPKNILLLKGELEDLNEDELIKNNISKDEINTFLNVREIKELLTGEFISLQEYDEKSKEDLLPTFKRVYNSSNVAKSIYNLIKEIYSSSEIKFFHNPIIKINLEKDIDILKYYLKNISKPDTTELKIEIQNLIDIKNQIKDFENDFTKKMDIKIYNLKESFQKIFEDFKEKTIFSIKDKNSAEYFKGLLSYINFYIFNTNDDPLYRIFTEDDPIQLNSTDFVQFKKLLFEKISEFINNIRDDLKTKLLTTLNENIHEIKTIFDEKIKEIIQGIDSSIKPIDKNTEDNINNYKNKN
jgi:hypothetical protein